MSELTLDDKQSTKKTRIFPISARKWQVLITLFSVGLILEILEGTGTWYAFEIGELLTSCCIYYTIVYVTAFCPVP